jgi:membrane-bound lytic murein transglycosylase D
MAKNPEQYGLTDLVPDAPVLSDTVTTDYAIDLRLVADLTGATLQEIVALNPALLRLTTPRDIPYDLHMPPGTQAAYLDRLKDIPEENRASWRFHIVRDGETLDQIAASLHARSAEIAAYNEITAAKPMEAGDELVVPVAGVSASATGQERYTAGRNDTLITVADRFGVTVEQLRAWNHLSSNRVTPGRMLFVTEPVRLAPGMRSAARGRAKQHAAVSAHGTHAAGTTGKPSASTHSAKTGVAPHAASKSTAAASKSIPAANSKKPAKKVVH